jgi:hypothetical protein
MDEMLNLMIFQLLNSMPRDLGRHLGETDGIGRLQAGEAS